MLVSKNMINRLKAISWFYGYRTNDVIGISLEGLQGREVSWIPYWDQNLSKKKNWLMPASLGYLRNHIHNRYFDIELLTLNLTRRAASSKGWLDLGTILLAFRTSPIILVQVDKHLCLLKSAFTNHVYHHEQVRGETGWLRWIFLHSWIFVVFLIVATTSLQQRHPFSLACAPISEVKTHYSYIYISLCFFTSLYLHLISLWPACML